MFLGTFKTEFSGKNRLILPKKFRKFLGNEEKLYLFLGSNGEIWGFDQENWNIQVENVLNIPLSSTEGRKERLKFFSRSEECVLDGQGRFVLPQNFAQQVDLKKQIVMIGAGDHFEIWEEKNWERYQNAEKI